MTLDELNNPYYRLNTFYKIKNKQKEIIPFKFNPQQEKLYKNLTNKDIVLKSRQIGISTFYLLCYLDDCIFNANTTTGILAHKRSSLEYLFEIIKLAYEELPGIIKPQADYSTKYSLSFENNSKLFVSLEIRSTTCNNLHISEAAFIDDAGRIKASLETVPLNGRVSIESTPNGMTGDFYERWTASRAGDMSYGTHFFPWYKFEEYQLPSAQKEIRPNKEELALGLTSTQINFRRSKRKDLGELFFQEYPENDMTCFLTSERSFFDLMIIKNLYAQRKKPVYEKEGLVRFAEYDKTHIYAAGADIAEGLGGDYSVLTIVDLNNAEAALRYRGHIRPDVFAHKIYELCKDYRFPCLGVERNGMGQTTILELEHLAYPDLYSASKDKIGWETTVRTKPIALNYLKKTIEDSEYVIADEEFLKECLTFINKAGKLCAVGENHDDVVMAYAIALQIALHTTNQLTSHDLSSIKLGAELETFRQFKHY